MFTAAATQAILRLRCEATEVVQGTRFGQRIQPNSTKASTTVSVTNKSKVNGAVAASMSVDAKNLAAASASSTASAGAQRENERSETTSASTETETLRVEALGGDRWKISEPAKPYRLKGTYLPNEVICQIRKVRQANRQQVELSVEIRQMDLEFAPQTDQFSDPLFGNRNREKLFKILMAKSLHETIGDGRVFDGVLVVSAGASTNDED